jgi:hypothetical protein
MHDKEVDPTACDNYCIILAAEKNFWQIIPHLLNDPRVDPSAQEDRYFSL